MRGLLSLLTLTATLVCLLSLPDATQSRQVDRQRRHVNRKRRDSSPEMPKHRTRRDASPEVPKYRFKRDEPSILPKLRNKRDTPSFPTTTRTPLTSGAADEVQRVVKDFLVDAIKYAESKVHAEDGGSLTEAVLEFLLGKLRDSGSVEGKADEDIRKDLVTRLGGDKMEQHLRHVAKKIENGGVTSNHYNHGTHGQDHHGHGADGHHSDTQIPGHRGHGSNHHGGHGTAQDHPHGHRPEHTNGITTTHAAAHHQGHHGKHRHSEGTDQQESTESFTLQDDFEFTAKSVRSHVIRFLENMSPWQIERFLAFLDNLETEQVFKGEVAFLSSEAIKAHLNMVFDRLEAANDTDAERALRVLLHYLHGFEYSEFRKLQGSYIEDPTLEYARGFALGMVDRLVEEHGEQEIQTSLAEMEYLLNKFEKQFSTEPLHNKHKHHGHHGDGPPATFEAVTALVNKVFGEIENNADQSKRDHELKIIAQILHSFTGHHDHQGQDLETDEGLVTLESVKEQTLKLVQTLNSHKQTQALANLANMLLFFEAKASNTQPAVHFEDEFQGETPVSSHHANTDPAAAMKLVDEFVERYVAMDDDALLTKVLRTIIAYFVELETEEKQKHHHNGNHSQQKDDDVSKDEAEVSSDVPEGNTRNLPNTNPSLLPTIGNRAHGFGSHSLGGFAAAPEMTGVGSGIPVRGGVTGSHNTPHFPAHTIGHRGFRKRK